MIIQELKAVQFKNCGNDTLTLHPKFNCFSGLNGAGKTNILDAVHVLCMTKSFYALKDDDLISWGEEFYRLTGQFGSQDEISEIVVKYPRDGKKEVLKNGERYKRYADHLGFCPLVYIAPGDEMKWLSASMERRRWMDVTLSQADKKYLESLMSYRRQLRQRNAFLKGGRPVKMRSDLLSVYNLRMAPSLELIRSRRADFIKRINPFFSDLYRRISGGSEEVDLKYQPDIEGDPNQIWEDSWPFDTAAKRTTRGAHRDDVLITIQGQDAKSFASQGQRKSILLAARLAQYFFLNEELGVKPLLLLDDIFDKLDPERVSSLIDLIGSDEFGQVLLTDTEPQRLARIFDEKEVSYYHYLVEDGNYKKI